MQGMGDQVASLNRPQAPGTGELAPGTGGVPTDAWDRLPCARVALAPRARCAGGLEGRIRNAGAHLRPSLCITG